MFLCPTEFAVLWECKLERYSCYRNSLTLPPRALKSKAVHPCGDSFNKQNHYCMLGFTSIFFAGPISLNRLALSTGTASKVSVLSAPVLCLEVLKGEPIHTEHGLTFITASIKTSMPCCFATDIALTSSSLVPHRVLVVPFW
jgi:hypothetical protein